MKDRNAPGARRPDKRGTRGRPQPSRRIKTPVLAIGALAVLALLLGGAAFARSRGSGAVTTENGAAAVAASTGGAPVIPVANRVVAPSFRVQTASFGDGSVFDLAHERGHVVVVYFMAGWCLTCVPEASALAKLETEYRANGIRILALDVERTEGEPQLAAFRAHAGNGQYLWGFDHDLSVAQALNVRSLDSTVVIDREGRIAYRDSVPTPYSTLQAVVRALS